MEGSSFYYVSVLCHGKIRLWSLLFLMGSGRKAWILPIKLWQTLTVLQNLYFQCYCSESVPFALPSLTHAFCVFFSSFPALVLCIPELWYFH